MVLSVASEFRVLRRVLDQPHRSTTASSIRRPARHLGTGSWLGVSAFALTLAVGVFSRGTGWPILAFSCSAAHHHLLRRATDPLGYRGLGRLVIALVVWAVDGAGPVPPYPRPFRGPRCAASLVPDLPSRRWQSRIRSRLSQDRLVGSATWWCRSVAARRVLYVALAGRVCDVVAGVCCTLASSCGLLALLALRCLVSARDCAHARPRAAGSAAVHARRRLLRGHGRPIFRRGTTSLPALHNIKHCNRNRSSGWSRIKASNASS